MITTTIRPAHTRSSVRPYVVKFTTQTGLHGSFQAFTYTNAVSVWRRFKTAEIWFGATRLR